MYNKGNPRVWRRSRALATTPQTRAPAVANRHPFLSALPEEHFSVKMYKVSGKKREQKKHIFSSAGDPRDIQNGLGRSIRWLTGSVSEYQREQLKENKPDETFCTGLKPELKSHALVYLVSNYDRLIHMSTVQIYITCLLCQVIWKNVLTVSQDDEYTTLVRKINVFWAKYATNIFTYLCT